MKQPWLKFYTADWIGEPKLRVCSMAARGLWMEMICLMHQAEPCGFLLMNGKPITSAQLVGLTGSNKKDIGGWISELEDAGVFSRNDSGIIFSRRMRRDIEKSERDKANGKMGGNPKINPKGNGGVNPQENPSENHDVNGDDKAQKLEARTRLSSSDFSNEKSSEAPPDPKTELYHRGKEILGAESGGFISKLLKAKQNSVPRARAALEEASEKADAKQYLGAIIRGKERRTEQELREAGELW